MKQILRAVGKGFRELRERLEERQAERKVQRRRAGYEFAMGDYFAGRASMLELEACTATAGAFGKYDEFDMGIDDALRKLESVGLPNIYTDAKY